MFYLLNKHESRYSSVLSKISSLLNLKGSKHQGWLSPKLEFVDYKTAFDSSQHNIAHWDKVGGRLVDECWPELKPSFTLNRGASIFTIGSCFAREIEEQLIRLEFRVPVNDFSAPASLRPGPEMFTTNSNLVWAVIASMYIGNVILLLMNLPLAGLFARLLNIPYSWIYPPILAICVTGAITISNSIEDAWVMLGFGVLGWLMKRHDWPAAPMVLGLVLGPLFENTLRQSLTLSHGSGMIFLSRPITAALIAASVLAVLMPVVTAFYLRYRRIGLSET